jgi:hypothetical protein
LIVVAYVLLLFANDQIEDALLGAAQDWSPLGRPALAFYIWNFILALTVWFWARLLLGQTRVLPPGLPAEFTLPLVQTSTAKLVLWVPRILGAVIPIASAAAIWRVAAHANGETQSTGIGISLLVVLALYLAITILRRPTARGVARVAGSFKSDRIGPKRKTIMEALEPTGPTGAFTGAGLNPIAIGVAAIWLFVCLVATVWALADPVGMGQFFGAVTVVPIGLASICSGLSLAVLLTQTLHIPVFAGLVVLAIVASYSADNHQLYPAVVATSDKTTPSLDATPSTLDDAYKSFLDQAPRKKLLIVATAGGGIRAAFWTAYALASLHDSQKDKFDKALFAISSVSGGSYGAVIYRAMVASGANPPCTTDLQDSQPKPASYADCVPLYLGPDSLGPTLVALLFPDMQQRLIPVSILPDRARALELAWQDAWQAHAPKGKEGLMAGPFNRLWKDCPLPILLLNGTSVRAGRRIITTNIELSPNMEPVFHDATPFSRLTPLVISASTAVSNSARFPYISPPGTIPAVDGSAADQIVDGGIFENSGSETALELYEYLIRKPKENRPAVGVLQITSDPDQPDPVGRCGLPDGLAGASRFLPDVLSAPAALFASRSARGTAAMEALRARVRSDAVPDEKRGDAVEAAKALEQAPYFAIRLSRTDAQTFAPLGWKLSLAAQNGIQNAWPKDSNGGCNAKDITKLIKWLNN